MENKECNCSECEHWEECEIGLILHNPMKKTAIERFVKKILNKVGFNVVFPNEICDDFKILKGDKVAQCTLKEHKGVLMGYESDIVRKGGFGSTGK